MLEKSLKPILFRDTKVLILGAYPSIVSYEKGFYYANSRSHFWKVMEAVTNYPINNKDQKIWLLKESNIGLWDIVKSASRDIDTTISDIDVNDMASLVEEYESIELIAFTSKLAENIYKSHFDYLDIKTLYLPSPFLNYTKMSFDKKVEVYKELLTPYIKVAI
jgi:hypoxanthine-DNA glycosylase